MQFVNVVYYLLMLKIVLLEKIKIVLPKLKGRRQTSEQDENKTRNVSSAESASRWKSLGAYTQDNFEI